MLPAREKSLATSSMNMLRGFPEFQCQASLLRSSGDVKHLNDAAAAVHCLQELLTTHTANIHQSLPHIIALINRAVMEANAAEQARPESNF